MADITRYPFVHHLRGTPTGHVQHLRRGRVVRAGTGVSFFFRPLTAVLSEIPVDDRELPLLFHARTADFQDVTVQVTVTYRVADPTLAAARLDFSLDPATGRWRGTPLEQVAGLLSGTAQQHVLDLLARTPLLAALATGATTARDQIAAGLATDTRVGATGLVVLDVRVVAVRAEPEVDKALRTPTRERLQQEADRATFERRALAVERERAISENELQSQIELARREEQLVTQRGANARRQAEEAAAASAIDTAAQADREQLLAQTRAAAARVTGEADGAAETARMAAYSDAPPELLLALAAREAAGKLPPIGNLVLTPDLLAPVLARLTGADGTA